MGFPNRREANRLRSIALLVLMLGAASLHAHHNAWAPDRTRQVTIEGVVEKYTFAAPHVEIQIRTAEGAVYTAEWQTTMYLSNQFGITPETLKAGDEVIVRGSPYKDPAVRKITLLAEIRRRGDGWVWKSVQYP